MTSPKPRNPATSIPALLATAALTVKLTKKNALFAGSDDGARTWARCASLIGTCKLNGVNPQVYLTDTLRRIVDMHPVSRIDELMPWNFTPTIPSVTRQQG